MTRGILGFLAAIIWMLATASGASAERRVTDLSRNWRFQFGVEAAAPQAPAFDDAAWERVRIPHSWNRLGAYSLERAPGSNADQGVGWYRLEFSAPRLRSGERYYLEFDAVSNLAQVWLNGARVGEHRGAFSRFRFDITEHLRPGENLLAVSADNSAPRPPGSSTADIIPLAGDFFVHGGIYRGVRLIAVSDAHIDMQDYGGPGVYAHAADVSAQAADVHVLTRLRNSGTGGRDLTAVTTLRDARRRVIGQTESPVRIAANGTAELRQELAVSSPHLWDGRADPYLYSVTVELKDGARTIDRVAVPLGIRSFRIDANEGFFLNERHLQLFGASRHQDRDGRGWALTPADHAEDMRIMLEMGVNTVRHAHYQHAQEWADAADRAGLVVWAEAPFVAGTSFDGSPPSAALVDNARQQTIELIRQNYNHPSIFMWSVGNEVDAAALQMNTRTASRSLGLLQNLAQLAREEDPSRPSIFADCCEDEAMFEEYNDEELAGATDLIGYNRYYGWYYGRITDFGPSLDALHAKHPNIPLSVSEYGAGGAFSQHSDNPEGGLISSNGRPHPEEFQSWFHENSWLQMRDRPYIFATWLWNMFDFAASNREEGESVDMNDKGLVSYDRTRRKDAFYFYQANLSDEPMLHITGRRYLDRAYPILDVRAYSNAERVTLTVNGLDIGETACTNGICVWPGVRLQPGENIVRAHGRIGARRVSDEVRWNAPDAAEGLRIESGAMIGRESDLGRFGSDNFFVGGAPRVLRPPPPARTPPASPPASRPGPPPRIVVEGASDPALFATYREGDFAYQLPLPDGQWRIRLLTFEPDADAAATRTFNVAANGRTVLSDFNPAQEAGGALRAVEREFTVVAADGAGVRVDFQSAGGAPIVAALIASP